MHKRIVSSAGAILSLLVGILAVTPALAGPLAGDQAQATLPPIPAGLPATFTLGVSSNDVSWITGSGVPFNTRYQILNGGVNTGSGWATWTGPSGQFALDYVTTSRANNLIPVFVYNQIKDSTPSNEYGNLNRPGTMKAYYNDFKLLMQKAAAAGGPVFVDIEPDLWPTIQNGYANDTDNAANVPASVASSGQADVAGLPNTFYGYAQALVRLRDLYGPNVSLGPDISTWATGNDIDISTKPDFDVATHASRTAAFLNSLGGGFQLFFFQTTNRDAAYNGVWWDDTNTTYPNFNRIADWLGRIVTASQKRVLMWQVPEGNRVYRTMNNTPGHYQDNRPEYFLGPNGRAHLQQWANVGVVGMLFGGGGTCCTHQDDARRDGITNPAPINGNNTVSTVSDDDGGYIRQNAAAYYGGGALPLPGGGPLPTATATAAVPPTNTPTRTPTAAVPPTNTPTRTPTVAGQPTNTATRTPTVTRTPTRTPSVTRTATNPPAATNTPTRTPTQAAPPTNTPSRTPTRTPTPGAGGLPPVPSGLPNTFSFGLLNYDTGWISETTIPLNLRYQYLSAGVNTGNGWATWNSPPGQFATNYMNVSRDNGLIPAFIYYQILQSAPNYDEYSNLNNASTMRAYYDDFKLLMQKAGAFGQPVFVDIEPDLWPTLQNSHANDTDNAANVSTSVASSGQADVAGYPNNFYGFSQALVHIRNLYAPNVRLGLDASNWATGRDIGTNTDPNFDVATHARRTAAFLNSSGAGFDLLFYDPSDRDAGYNDAWWDDTNTAFPNFDRIASWLGQIVNSTQKRVLMWQVPQGNRVYRTMNNSEGHYQDNRPEYFLGPNGRTHLQQWANAGVAGIMFGSGAGCCTHYYDFMEDGVTNPPPINGNNTVSSYADDDGGYLRLNLKAYYQNGVLPLP